MINHEVERLRKLAETDYDAFWSSLDKRDKNLTADLTIEETYDACYVDTDEIVWMFTYNDITGAFEVEILGHSQHLIIYADQELTGLETDEQVSEFVEILGNKFREITVEKGQSPSGNSAVEWIRFNPRVVDAWDDALQDERLSRFRKAVLNPTEQTEQTQTESQINLKNKLPNYFESNYEGGFYFTWGNRIYGTITINLNKTVRYDFHNGNKLYSEEAKFSKDSSAINAAIKFARIMKRHEDYIPHMGTFREMFRKYICMK